MASTGSMHVSPSLLEYLPARGYIIYKIQISMYTARPDRIEPSGQTCLHGTNLCTEDFYIPKIYVYRYGIRNTVSVSVQCNTHVPQSSGLAKLSCIRIRTDDWTSTAALVRQTRGAWFDWGGACFLYHIVRLCRAIRQKAPFTALDPFRQRIYFICRLERQV